MNNAIKKVNIKNIKTEYAAKSTIFYFNEDDLNTFSHIHRTIREGVEFVKIGSAFKHDFDQQYREEDKYRIYKETFFSWDSNKNNSEGEPIPLKAKHFFKSYGNEINRVLRDTDIAFVIYKDKNELAISYVERLLSIFKTQRVFGMHLVLSSLVVTGESKKWLAKLNKKIERYQNVVIQIDESNIIQTYDKSNIANRNHYSAKFIGALLESYLAPLLDPHLNVDFYKNMKQLFFSKRSHFVFPSIPTMGFSNSKEDWLDKALISALSSPIFSSAYKGTDSFIVSLKTPYLTDKMLARVDYVLRSILEKNTKIIYCKYIGDFDLDVYAQINILALGVNPQYIETNKDTNKENIQILLKEALAKKEIFNNSKTETILIDIPFTKME